MVGILHDCRAKIDFDESSDDEWAAKKPSRQIITLLVKGTFTNPSAPFQPLGAELCVEIVVSIVPHREDAMSSVVKVLEVIAESDKSFDEAAQHAVQEASKTVRQIKSIWIENFSGMVEGDRIVKFRVNAKLSFMIEGHK